MVFIQSRVFLFEHKHPNIAKCNNLVFLGLLHTTHFHRSPVLPEVTKHERLRFILPTIFFSPLSHTPRSSCSLLSVNFLDGRTAHMFIVSSKELRRESNSLQGAKTCHSVQRGVCTWHGHIFQRNVKEYSLSGWGFLYCFLHHTLDPTCPQNTSTHPQTISYTHYSYS